MNITEHFLDSSKEIWEQYHKHPFVRGIGEGTLDKEKFRFYIIQDYLYLIDYAKVFSIGAAKAGIFRRCSSFQVMPMSCLPMRLIFTKDTWNVTR